MFTLMAPFGYERPANLAEALAAVARLTGAGAPFAYCGGGTDLVANLKQQGTPVGTLVSLTGVPELRGISRSPEDGVPVYTIGAMVPLADLAASVELRRELPCVAEAARKVASPQIRNRATLGGNLLVNNRCLYFNQSRQNRATHDACFKSGGDSCHVFPGARRGHAPLCRARFVSDLAPVLMLLRARLRLAGPGGERWVNLEEFYLQDGIERNQLRVGEILAQVEIKARSGMRLRYRKLRIRNAIDFPSLGVAVSWERTPGGVELGVGLTGLNPYPILLRFPGHGGAGLEELIETACREAERRAVPLKQDFFGPAYRKKMVPVLIRRNLMELVSKEGGAG